MIALIGIFSPTAKVQAVGSCSDGVSTTPAECGANNSYWTSDADACGALDGIGNLICKTHKILNSIIPVLVAFGIVYFVWGITQYVIGSEEEAKTKGKNKIIYGIIGLAVIVGLWGLVNVVVNTFDLGGQSYNTTDLTSPIDNAVQGRGCILGKNFQSLLIYATCIISTSVIPFIFALAVAIFVFGVVQYVINSDEEAKKEKGKQFMLWGIIALTVMVSVWGLVSILTNTFEIDTNFVPQVKSP